MSRPIQRITATMVQAVLLCRTLEGCMPESRINQPACHAKVSPTESKIFLCHNLGVADDNADPFNPHWATNGGYWQWGTRSRAAAGPNGPAPGQFNDGVIAGWTTTPAIEVAWSDSTKNPADPCPEGFRVPSKKVWEAVIANNTITQIGSWAPVTNFDSALKVGEQLVLPAAGYRYSNMGALLNNGYYGYYWSSTAFDNQLAYMSYFVGGYLFTGTGNRIDGYSIRCVLE